MRKEEKISWSKLAPLGKWVVLGVVLAVAGAVGCVNLSLTGVPNKRPNVLESRPKYPAYAAARLTKRPPVPPPKSKVIANSAKRTPARSVDVANRKAAAGKTAEKSTEILSTAFDARKRSTIVQSGARLTSRAKVVPAGGSQVADPFLSLPGAVDQPMEVPEPAPERVPQEPRPRFFPPESYDADAEYADPKPVKNTTPPPPEERVDVDRLPREVVPGFIRSPEEEAKLKAALQQPKSPRNSASGVPAVPRTAARAGFLRRPVRSTPVASKNRNFVPNAMDDLPPDPRMRTSRNDVAQREQALRANSKKEKKAQPRSESGSLDSGEEIRPLDPNYDYAQLPRLADSPGEVPPVELLAAPPVERELLTSNQASPGRHRDVLRRKTVSRYDGAEAEMADTFSQAAESRQLSQASPFNDLDQKVEATRSRGIPARTISRQTQRPNQKRVVRRSAQSVAVHAPPSLPVIRPANRTGLPTLNSASHPRSDNLAMSRTPPATLSAPVTEPAEAFSQTGGRQDGLSAEQSLPVSSGPQPVRLTGIILEEDEELPATPVVSGNRFALMTPDLSDSSPTHVPPPPMSAVPPPLLDPAIPQQAGPGTARKNRNGQAAAAPAIPGDTTSGLDFPMKENFDGDIGGHPGPSLIGRTSLIGLGVGITGLLGLVVWRYLDRRSHRRRRINLAILRAPEAASSTTTDADSKTSEPVHKADAPRLHRAA